MKSFYFLFFLTCLSALTKGQSTANYTFATSVSGSLTDMSSGTTTLLPPDLDDGASLVTDIGFDFFFQGTMYAKFSVNSNGALRLGTIIVNTGIYAPLGQALQSLISAYAANQRTHAGDGKVHYKVTGTAPNRALVVEWLNMQSDFNAGGTANNTYQVRLYETTGVIEFVYGSMTMSANGATDANSNTPQIGFSFNNSANTVGYVTAAQSGTPAPTYSSSNAAVGNSYTAGAITALSGATDGARRMFSFTPSIPAAPTGLSFTSVATVSTTLNWTDNATNELGYAIYRSTDGVNYTYISLVAANTTTSAQTGLYGNTVYYWKVMAFSEGGLSSALIGSQATSAAGSITSNGTGGGLWSNVNTWVGGVLPTTNDSVTIRNGDVVTIDAAGTAYKLTVGEGVSGTLQFETTTGRTLTIAKDVTIAPGAVFQSATSGTQTGHTLSLGGDLTNNGTLNFSTNTNTAAATVSFTGAANNTFSGTGATTNIRTLGINKGAINNILELSTSNFTVRSVATDVAGFLTLTSGTFKISGNFTYTGRTFTSASYTIAATAGVWLNNPNYTIAAQNGSPTINGLLRITSGTWNISTLGTATVTSGANAAYQVDGGTLTLAGRLAATNTISYTQSGGTVNVANLGNSGTGASNASFALTSGASTFNMTGGTINLVQPCTGATPVDYNNTANIIAANGTLQVGKSSTATNFNFRIRGNVPNLVIDNTTNNKTATATAQVNLLGSTTISTGATFVINGQTCSIQGTTFTNNGTLTGTATSTRFYFLGGKGATTYQGTGVVTAPLTTWEVDNQDGVIIDPAVNQVVTLQFNDFSGGLTNSNKLTIGNGGATTATIQMGKTGVTGIVNGFDVAPVFNPGTGGVQLFYAPELTGRTMGLEVPSSRTLSMLSITNPNDIYITGGDITTTALTMTGGNIVTGSNTITLGTDAVSTGTYNYTSGTIVGNFKRWISTATGNTDFPVGITTATRNASINFTTAPTTSGTLTAQWISAAGGSNGLPLTEGSVTIHGTSPDGYWRVVAGDGLAGGSYTGTFTATGIANVTDISKLVLLKRPNSTQPWILDGTPVAPTGTTSIPVIARTNMSGFSEFGIGAEYFAALPIHLQRFSGQKSGATNILRWTTASEQNNTGFEVQRSGNGTDYSVTGFVKAQSVDGNSSTALNYNFIDYAPSGTVQYYRLRQVDLDGKSEYSNVVVINGETSASLTITNVYPNPAISGINILVGSPVKDKLSVSVMDINGNVAIQRVAYVEVGNNSMNVDVSMLAAGMYQIRLVGSDGRVVVGRFSKK